jgi:hypothetical protein
MFYAREESRDAHLGLGNRDREYAGGVFIRKALPEICNGGTSAACDSVSPGRENPATGAGSVAHEVAAQGLVNYLSANFKGTLGRNQRRTSCIETPTARIREATCSTAVHGGPCECNGIPIGTWKPLSCEGCV